MHNKGLFSGQEVEMPRIEVQARETERKVAKVRHTAARATRGSRWILTNMKEQKMSLQRKNSPLVSQIKCLQRMSARA